MSNPYADRNLLFGILAVQLDFISRDALIEAMNAWVLEKSKPLGEILVAQGVLQSDTYELLDALVEKHLKQHGGDPEKSLASVSSIASVREELRSLADPDIEASLAHVSAARKEQDPYATLPSTLGESTSAGTRFRILRPHAKGGLGQVSVALDEELHREVALKELQDHHADDPHSRSRFTLEAEITGGLEHPGIVPVYGLGQYADGRPFYAMRFIRGDSLKDAIERFHQKDSPLATSAGRGAGGEGFSSGWRDDGERTLELRKLLGRFIDVCNAIEYAHSRGVLHRDLKPGNIMLGKYGETLVVDWGLAKPLGRSEETAKATDEATLRPSSGSGVAPTQMGSAIGTPAYMSPEQAAGRLENLGPRSDVYSLGATMYSLLTGQPPFSDTDLGMVLAHVQMGEFPRPREIKRDVPAPLEAICLKAMATKFGHDHPTTLAVMSNLGQLYNRSGEPGKALPFCERTLELTRAKLGEDHPQTLGAMGSLALTRMAVGELDEAILLFEQAIERSKAKLGESHYKTQAWIYFLGDAYLRQGQWEKAEAILEDTLEKLESTTGEDQSYTAQMMFALASAYLQSGKLEKSERFFRQSLVRQRERSPDDWLTFYMQSSLGDSLVRLQRFDEAEPMLLEGYWGMQSRITKIAPNELYLLKEAVDRVVKLYEAWDKPAQANDWRKKLDE